MPAGLRKTLILAALVTISTGVGLIIDRPKGAVVEWLAIPFLVCGGCLLTWAVWPLAGSRPHTQPSVATRLLAKLTMQGRLVRFFPAFGVALIILDLIYNWAASPSPSFQTEDVIVLSAAATLLAYCFVPVRFARERDFALLFFVSLNAILVVPLLIARLYYTDLERSVDLYSWVALAPQASSLLNLLGIGNQVHVVAGSTAPGLTFVPEHVGTQVTVVITTSCSGIYSFGIFGAAFIAFVLTEFERLTKRIWVLLGLGLIAAYAANVLRMVAIIMVGYYTDTEETDLQNMLIAHSYAGWLIFLAWITLFWGILMKWIPEGRLRPDDDFSPRTCHGSEPACSICSKALSPAIPATRCECGAYYHLSCSLVADRCPTCGSPRRQAIGRVPTSADP